ncbi:hypothetical protein [Bombilactobacillus bombi]|uniref:hypothetical protein n=1 Tax=Bombilactobacillus bombi TaxID=1303590 RepID=UPI0015E620B2|nr:hypothetical protein [Bombilactobacillus bombi]MBA1435221.1 hypothetical protein [Bombilactobacillus bombi]
MRKDPYVTDIYNFLYGYHPVLFGSIEESGIWAILTQHSSIRKAIILKAKIKELLSPKILIEKNIIDAFPSVNQILHCSNEDLLSIIHNVKKVEYITNFVETLNNAKENIYRFNHKELYDFLISIKGIGPWSAEFIILRGLGISQWVPLNEKANYEVFKRYYSSKVSFENVCKYYNDHKGDWIHYLRAYEYLKIKK